MRSLLPSALLTALALAILPSVPQSAHARAGVLRCQMPDGSNVYTNKACGALGATSAPLSGDVLNRIQRDQRYEASMTGATQPAVPIGTGIAPVPQRRATASGCADSPQQLAMDLQGAVALGDVNRVAESYHWNGMRNAEAQRVMLRLEQLASRPMVSVEYFDARIGGLGAGFADAGESSVADGDSGMLQAMVSAGDGTQVVDFSVQRDQGCYFVRY